MIRRASIGLRGRSADCGCSEPPSSARSWSTQAVTCRRWAHQDTSTRGGTQHRRVRGARSSPAGRAGGPDRAPDRRGRRRGGLRHPGRPCRPIRRPAPAHRWSRPRSGGAFGLLGAPANMHRDPPSISAPAAPHRVPVPGTRLDGRPVGGAWRRPALVRPVHPRPYRETALHASFPGPLSSIDAVIDGSSRSPRTGGRRNGTACHERTTNDICATPETLTSRQCF